PVPPARRRDARALARPLSRRDEGGTREGVRRAGFPGRPGRVPAPAPHAGARRLRIPLRGEGQEVLPQARPRSAAIAPRGRRGVPTRLSRAHEPDRRTLTRPAQTPVSTGFSTTFTPPRGASTVPGSGSTRQPGARVTS